jgi:SAM-dependent methyltransferase
VIDASDPHRSLALRLVASSALMLLLELALIRWLGANVVHLSYFSNFVLLGSFLGIGLGFLVSRKTWSVVPVAMPLLALLVTAVLVFPVTIQRQGSDVIYFTAMKVAGPPARLALPVIFLLVAVILAGPAEMVGRCFGGLEPLTAYRYDLIGSLLGIGTFTVMSFLRAPSVVWGLVASLVFLSLATGLRMRVVYAVSGVIVVGMLLSETLTAGVSWSPYYKIQTHHSNSGPGALSIWVNGVPHQTMAKASWRLQNAPEQYGTPYQRLPKAQLDNVLVVGAGSGTDVAIALKKGARHVDAVEIDPRILQLGRQHNPDHAYQDPRVTAHINDGRAFLQSTDMKYDLILFALPDSLALVNGASQIRLESFLFTQQALESVRDHLEPDGGFAMYNYYRENWLIDRLAGAAATVFGHTPCVDNFTSHQAVVAVALRETNQACGAAYVPTTEVIAPATDNSPFLYFKGGMIPWLYVWTLLGVIAVSLVLVRAVGGQGDATVRRPVLHGCGVPAPGDQERGQLRPDVRHHLVRERSGVHRGAGDRPGGRGDDPKIQDATTASGVRRYRGLPGPGVGDPARHAAGIVLLAASGVCEPVGVPADLSGQHRVRQAVRSHWRLPVGVWDQPARVDRRGVPGVRRLAHRLRQPADRGGGSLSCGVHADPAWQSPDPGALVPLPAGAFHRPHIVVSRW